MATCVTQGRWEHWVFLELLWLCKFYLCDLTQPLEKGLVTLSRVMQSARFESSYFLVPSAALSACGGGGGGVPRAGVSVMI